MRQLGIYEDEAQAKRLGDALFVECIESTVNETRESTWAVWVHDEEQMPEAREIAEEFALNPDAPRFLDAPKIAANRRKAEGHVERKAQARIRRAERSMQTVTGPPPLTVGLAIVCVAVFALMNSPHGDSLTSLLSIQSLGRVVTVRHGGLHVEFFGDVMSGQVWRLVTPILLHFTIFHLIFNLWWLWSLGSALERGEGTLRYGLMLLVFALASNLVQYVATFMPYFGGLSGVVYGLFGYLWMRGRFEPASRYTLPGSTVLLMLAWYVICFTGLVGAVANGAHTGGLVGGMAWGYLASGHLRRALRG